MKPLLPAVVSLASLLAVPALAQEHREIANHFVFEMDGLARLAVDYQEIWWIVAGLALIGVVVCDIGWAARYILQGPVK